MCVNFGYVKIAVLVLKIRIGMAWFNSVRASVTLLGISIELVTWKLPLFFPITVPFVRERNQIFTSRHIS